MRIYYKINENSRTTVQHNNNSFKNCINNILYTFKSSSIHYRFSNYKYNRKHDFESETIENLVL